MPPSKIKTASIRQAFADTVFDLASDNPHLYVVSADLASSLKLSRFASRFKNRFVECGVAEANAAGVAAGIAKAGKTVFLVSYACFSPAINWAVIRQSICYNGLNVKIIASHAGLMSAHLGASHQMLEDIALMRPLPNMEVFAPLDAPETEKIIKSVAFSSRPAYIRLVRPETPVITSVRSSFTIGKSQVLKSGSDITVLGYGPILTRLFASDFKQLSLDIINCSSIKPLDDNTILASLKKTSRCLIIEDHQKIGGLGEAVAALILRNNLKVRFEHLAVDNQFGQSASDYQTLYQHYGLGYDSIYHALTNLLK